MSEIVLTGHVDAISVQGRVARILDHKTGRKDTDYSQQALGYCALVLLNNPEIEEATCTVLWIRGQEVEHYTLTRAQLPAWIDRLKQEVAEWDGVYRPGSHCQYCPRNHHCPAVNALVRRDVAFLADLDVEEAVATRTPQEKVALLEIADHVGDVADRVRKALKAEVLRNGDIVGDRERLTIEVDERRNVDPITGFEILVESFDFQNQDLGHCMTISGSKAKEVVAKRAGKGKGAAAARELDAALEAAGAYTTTSINKLVTKRV